MSKRLLVVAIASTLVLTSAGSARANVITGVTIQDVSSQLTQNFTRAASFTVTAPGLNINGPGTYSDVPDGNMWLNTGNGCCGGFSSSDPTNNTDAHPQITWNLGGVYDVNSMRIWNYNENSGNPAEFTLRGIHPADVYTSTDGTNYTFLESITLNQAPGNENSDFS
jgi:hypothetical protein